MLDLAENTVHQIHLKLDARPPVDVAELLSTIYFFILYFE